eukprot:COSAG02_NODE_43558_length_373_cov_1.335766_1_plen_59_part_01
MHRRFAEASPFQAARAQTPLAYVFYTLTVHAHQSQRDDREVGRPNARKIRPLPAWANFE